MTNPQLTRIPIAKTGMLIRKLVEDVSWLSIGEASNWRLLDHKWQAVREPASGTDHPAVK
jgi:hypothetical protein